MGILKKSIADIDLLVFSDFNYGCLPQSLVDQIVLLAKSHKVMLAADSQSSSQIGDIARFKSMNLITPTEMEARISTRNKEDGLIIMAEKLKGNCEANFTNGGDGVNFVFGDEFMVFWFFY